MSIDRDELASLFKKMTDRLDRQHGELKAHLNGQLEELKADFNSQKEELKALQRGLNEVRAELEVPQDPAERLENEAFRPRLGMRDDQFSSRSTPSAASFDGRGKRSRPNSSYFDDY
ncbi:MAG: hypothetical protein H6705_16960 [Myxococcales bacterium]|nr:hypothetical protein [Myxococcales bacterium]